MTGVITTLFLGAVVGSIYALAAFGLVLTYRTSGVFNFAHGAVGMLFAFVFYQLIQGGEVNLVLTTVSQRWTLPTGLALVVVCGVLAPALGWGLDRVLFRRLRDAGEVVQIVATIGLLVALTGIAGVVWGAGTTLTPTSIFSDRVLTVAGFRATVEQVASVALVGAFAAALMVFLRATPLGIRMRAVVDRADLAELAGIDTRRMSALAWGIGTGFAALAGILIVPFFGSLDPMTLTFLVIAATAAAVVGRLESFPGTLAGGLAIGVAQLVVQRYTDGEVARQLRPAIPFLVLFAVLFLPRWKRRPTDRTTPPPLPPIARERSGHSRNARIAILGAVLVAAPFALGVEWQIHLALVPPMALILLSLVLLSGYAGQVSLCQAALAGFGAFTAAHLVGAGMPFPLAALFGGLAAVPLGAFLALRAASLSPLFLGFATLAFAAVMDEVFFTSRWFARGMAGIFFDRPGIITEPGAYYLAGLAVFALFALLIHNLRHGKVGYALTAMRDSEVGLASLGVNVPGLKFVSFCLSAYIAGLGGAMLAGAAGHATPLDFFLFQSLLVLAIAVIGGIGTWTGALAGAAILKLGPAVGERFSRNGFLEGWTADGQLDVLFYVFFGLAAIGLARNPHGILALGRQVFAGLVARAAPSRPPHTEPVGRQADGLVAFPEARFFHKPECLLAVGKEGKRTTARTRQRLEPCPVCEPDGATPTTTRR